MCQSAISVLFQKYHKIVGQSIEYCPTICFNGLDLIGTIFLVRHGLLTLAVRCGPGSSAIVFTSGGPIAAICQHLLGVPDDRIASLHFPLRNASVTKLLFQPDRLSLSYFNNVAHLDITARRDVLTYR
ncbi:histidine phosphatase family protein [Noviherbaspirillum saxi]|uniref:histidine phosphatase family protein n=1 Tax=Noviherbaspirillum saxi TaxID=2320863 RepID=UPI0013142C9D|nr:histidine phosphatase family protein [Noviherbaspirillum saxi]